MEKHFINTFNPRLKKLKFNQNRGPVCWAKSDHETMVKYLVIRTTKILWHVSMATHTGNIISICNKWYISVC